MLLTITSEGDNSQDLSYLLHKNPDKVQMFNITGGKAHVFYPEYSKKKTTVALLLDIDTIEIIRNIRLPDNGFMLKNYINDRPYVASSFTSHAISEVFSSALNGKCKLKPELVELEMDFEININVLKIKGGNSAWINKIFEPLGYKVEFKRHFLNENFTQWGESNYYSVKLKNNITLQKLLSQLYVLLPVFDYEKHYFISTNEIDKLLDKGKEWLSGHPEKDIITKRYLNNLKKYYNPALERLNENNNEDLYKEEIENINDVEVEKKLSLNKQRLKTVFDKVKDSGYTSIMDLGCGEGKLLKMLLKDSKFSKITGMDVSYSELQKAKDNLYYEELSDKQKERLTLIQGSLLYKDERLKNHEVATVIEVIEHLELFSLKYLEKVLFSYLKPNMIIITTPNSEYNQKYENLENELFRHHDHRFEWSRKEFYDWLKNIQNEYKYNFEVFEIGESDNLLGSPTQMAVLKKGEN